MLLNIHVSFICQGALGKTVRQAQLSLCKGIVFHLQSIIVCTLLSVIKSKVVKMWEVFTGILLGFHIAGSYSTISVTYKPRVYAIFTESILSTQVSKIGNNVFFL